MLINPIMLLFTFIAHFQNFRQTKRCSYAVLANDVQNLRHCRCKDSGFGRSQGRHAVPVVVRGHPEELPVGEPSGCVPALALPPPNSGKSWCPLSLYVDEHHDQREDWEGRLCYLPGFPRRHHGKDTMRGRSLRGGVLCAVGLGLCGCEMMWRTCGWTCAPAGVPPSPPHVRKERDGRGGWRVEEEREDWKRRAEDWRWQRVEEEGEVWKWRMKVGREGRRVEEDSETWKRKVKGGRWKGKGGREGWRVEQQGEGWWRMLKQLCCPSYSWVYYLSSRKTVFKSCCCTMRFFNGCKPKPAESFSWKARFSQGSVMKLHRWKYLVLV